MEELLLSIAIPTFNRANCLMEELECILPQLLPYKDITEVVISDNVSTDNTEDVVKALSSKYNYQIKYIKLKDPIYFEDNFENAFNLTRGKYVHLIGDDDLLCPDFYDILIKMLPDNYGLINFNRLAGDQNCSNNVLYEKVYSGAKVISSTEDFIKYVLWKPGFLTSLVFRRDCWEKGTPYVKKEYYGYQFLGRLYQGAIQLKTKSCYYYYPLIIMRNQRRTWSSQFILFWFVGLSNIFKDLEPHIPGVLDIWLSHLQDKKENYYIDGLLLSITGNQSFYRKKKHEFWPYMNTRQKVAFQLFSYFQPAKLLNYFFRGVKKLKRIL